ncbi:TetR/AcrR family transcriptional regulator [Sphaerimonospora mesophila]|uniref:TetR/AcrR family transcriptional regulator n=1 Tax=Sphaerimonospora mesophila TaxID=37483 RepID=UPI0006E121CF
MPTDRKHGGRRRADAERNIEAIVAAALAEFCRNPGVSMTDIARAAGVGRVTLYGHFPSREDLLDAVMARAIEDARATLGAVPTDGLPARDALAALIRSAWQVLDRHRRLHAAAVQIIGPDRLREHHEQPLLLVEDLLDRGRRDGTVRADLPPHWLATTVYSMLHAAALEVDAGRLTSAGAADVLEATLLPAISPVRQRDGGGRGPGDTA